LFFTRTSGFIEKKKRKNKFLPNINKKQKCRGIIQRDSYKLILTYSSHF